MKQRRPPNVNPDAEALYKATTELVDGRHRRNSYNNSILHSAGSFRRSSSSSKLGSFDGILTESSTTASVISSPNGSVYFGAKSPRTTYFFSPPDSPFGRKSFLNDLPIMVFEDVQPPELVDEDSLQDFAFKPPSEEYENDSEMLARVTRLGEDYIGRMRELARLGMFSSVRLHEDGEKPPNRRCSFCIDQEVIASAKTTKTSSKNNPRGCMCAGHIPRDNYLRKYKYSYTDNNNPGDYPALIRNETPNSELLCQLRADYTKTESETHIIEAKMFHTSICYIERVPLCDKIVYIDGSVEYRPNGKFGSKHFMQESESLMSIVTNIKNNAYLFVSASSEELVFSDSSGEYEWSIRLDQLIPRFQTSKDKILFANIQEFYRYVHTCDIGQHHAPVFCHHEGGIKLPVMNQVGDNGFPITSDVDTQHMPRKRRTPNIADKCFIGMNTSANVFLLGLKLLIARLEATSSNDYGSAAARIMADNMHDSIAIKAYNDVFDDAFDHSDSERFINYTYDEYYSDVYLPLVKKTLAKYEQAPEALKAVGTASLHGLIALNEMDHELTVHDAESLHPGSKPGEFVPVLTYYKGLIIILGNEAAYLAFLMHKQDILSENEIGIHPYWLHVNRSGGENAEQWLDIAEIQMLHEAKFGSRNLRKYYQSMINNMRKGRESEKLAIDALNQRFTNLVSVLERNLYSLDFIEKKIDHLHQKYDIECKTICNAITEKSPSKSPKLYFG